MTSLTGSNDYYVISLDIVGTGELRLDLDNTAGISDAYDNALLTAFSSGETYSRTNASGWNQQAYIKPYNASDNDHFGSAISISGETLLVGAPFEDENSTTVVNGTTAPNTDGLSDSGAVYVYLRSGNLWAQEAYIKSTNADTFDEFGRAVALSGDTLAVAAIRESENSTVLVNGATAPGSNGLVDSGAVYIFKRTTGNWAQEAYIKAANAGANDEFGNSVSLSGHILAVGSKNEDSDSSVITNGTTASNSDLATQSGAVYLYERSAGNWSQSAYIKASNVSQDDEFGEKVSVFGDTVVVAAKFEDEDQSVITNGTLATNSDGSSNSGAVYIYRHSFGTWAQEAYIKAANNETLDEFGTSVSLSGNYLAVGAPEESENLDLIVNGSTAPNGNGLASSGAVYLYERTGATWAPVAYLKVPSPDSGDRLGSEISLSGNTLAVSAPEEDENYTLILNSTAIFNENGLTDSGAVYVFRNSGTWDFESYIKPFNVESVNQFGSSLSLDGDTLVVGTPFESSNSTSIINGAHADTSNGGTDVGAVYIYRNTTRLFDPGSFRVESNTPSTITLAWSLNTGTGTGVRIVYASGNTAPADCTVGTLGYDGPLSTATVNSLTADTQYSFRICAYDGSVYSRGVEVTSATSN